MAAPPPKAPAKPALQSLPFASAHVVSCAEDVATIIPKLVLLGVTDPNRTVEQAVLDKTFDVKYKLGIKYNERERLGPQWKPEEGEWKKWVTAELRLVKMYAGDSFHDVITKDLARELKTNLDITAFRATKPVKKNFDGFDNPREPLIYEYRLPTSFKVRAEINPYHPMVPPLNLHKSNTWGFKTRELVRDGINGASTRHVRLLAQGDFRMEDKVAELLIETYLADPRPLPRNISNADQIKMEKDRLAKAIKDTRHTTPYKLVITIDWPSWCKMKAGLKPSPSIEEDMPTPNPAPNTASKKGPKLCHAIEDDTPLTVEGDDSLLLVTAPAHKPTSSASPYHVKIKKETPKQPSQPAKMPPPPISSVKEPPKKHIKSTKVATEHTRSAPRHSPPVHGHPSLKLRPIAASPLNDLPAPARHGHPSPKMGLVIKEATNTRGRHSTPAAKPQNSARERSPAASAAPATPSSASSGMDRPGAVKIIWGLKDRKDTVTILGTSKRNCRACGAKMRDFVALLNHLKSDQTHLGKEIKLQYWGDGQTVNVWIIDLPGEYGGTKLFVEDGREMKWKWLDDEARMASNTPLASGSGLVPPPALLEPHSFPLEPCLSSPAPPSPQPAPLSVSVFSPVQGVETKKDETEPAMVVEDHKKIALEAAEKLVDQNPVSPEYIRPASEAALRTVNVIQKDLILHDDVTRLPLRPGDNIVPYEHDREAQMRQTHIDAIWARPDLSEDEKDLWVVWDLYMLANSNMSRGAYKTQMPVTIKKFVCANWVWFHQRKSRTLAWMKKLGTLKVEGVITAGMATDGVLLLVPPIIPKEAWYRVDREKKWDNASLEENRRNWTALWNALVFLGERWDDLPPVMDIMVDQFIHVAGHLFLVRDHTADLKLSILDKLFSITTTPGEVIMRGEGYLEDGLGRKIKWGDMLASDVINLCHEEAVKMKFLDDEFCRYYATREKYFSVLANETLEAKMKGLFRHQATDFRLWQWRRAHEVELHLTFMNGEIDVGLLCSVLLNLRTIGGGQIGGPDAPPLPNHPLVVVGPLMKPKPLVVEPPPTGKRIPVQRPYGKRGFMECKCGTDVYESNSLRCRNANEKGLRRCLSPYYHRECTEEFRKDGSDGLFRPKNWYCEECEQKGWGRGEEKVEMKEKSSGVDQEKTKKMGMKGLGKEVVHSDSAQLPARKKQKTTEEGSGRDKGL